MKTRVKFNTIMLFLLGLFFSEWANAVCQIQVLQPNGSEIHTDSLHIKLGEADDSLHPKAWQGPLEVGNCKLDLGIIEQPIALAGTRYLYLPTYSGSVSKLNIIDLQTCLQQWQSPNFVGSVKITNTKLQLGNQRFRITDNCLPELTRKPHRNKN